MRIRHAFLPAVLVLVFVAANAFDLTLYPLATDDEALLNEPARTLAIQGTLDTPLLSPDHTPEPLVIQPPVQALLVAPVYRLFGFGIWQTRLASLLWAALALLAMALATAAVSDDSAAVGTAVLLFMLHPHLELSARMGRPEGLCITFMLLAFWTYRRGLDTPNRRALLMVAAGVLTGLACLTHFVAVGFTAGLWLVVGTRGQSRLRDLLAYSAGGLMVAALWGAFVVSQAPQFLTLLLQHGAMRSASGSVLERVAAEASRWLREARSYPGLILIYAVGIAYALRIDDLRSKLRDVMLICAAMVLFNALAMSKVSGFYPLYPATFMTIVSATALGRLVRLPSRPRVIAVSVLVVTVVTSVVRIAVPRVVAFGFQRDARSYRHLSEQLEGLVPAEARVWTVPEAWYALARDRRSVRAQSLGLNPRPDAAVDDYALVKSDNPLADSGFEEVGQVGDPLPLVLGRTFSNTDYRLTVYRSRLRHSAR